MRRWVVAAVVGVVVLAGIIGYVASRADDGQEASVAYCLVLGDPYDSMAIVRAAARRLARAAPEHCRNLGD